MRTLCTQTGRALAASVAGLPSSGSGCTADWWVSLGGPGTFRRGGDLKNTYSPAPASVCSVASRRVMTLAARIEAPQDSTGECTAAPAAKKRRLGQAALVQLDLQGRPIAAAPQPSLGHRGVTSKSATSKPASNRRLNGSQLASGPSGNSRPSPQAVQRVRAVQGTAGETDLGEGAVVAFHPASWSSANSRKLLQRLQEEVGWEHREVRVMGRRVMQPRLVAYMADDPSLCYTYSGLTLPTLPWSPAVAEVKAHVEKLAGCKFNSCLLNLYRDGSDHMGWHSDNELLYGRHPSIGSASFGATRDFILRHNEVRSNKWSYPLGNGDVLVMTGATQDHWQHAIPKRKGISEPRVNLTFRTVVHKQRQ